MTVMDTCTINIINDTYIGADDASRSVITYSRVMLQIVASLLQSLWKSYVYSTSHWIFYEQNGRKKHKLGSTELGLVIATLWPSVKPKTVLFWLILSGRAKKTKNHYPVHKNIMFYGRILLMVSLSNIV